MSRLGYHVVWCPKYWHALLTSPVKDRREALIRAKPAGQGWHPAA